jgi:hypothetical protein
VQHKRPAIIFSFGVAMLAGVLVAANDNSDRSTFYSGQQFTVNVKALEPEAASAVIARNSQLHSLYLSEACDPDGRQFVTVMDAVQSDSYSPLWRGVQIEFNPGYPCRQFHSESEIANAVKSGEISLNPTGYVYRCRVVGRK